MFSVNFFLVYEGEKFLDKTIRGSGR